MENEELYERMLKTIDDYFEETRYSENRRMVGGIQDEELTFEIEKRLNKLNPEKYKLVKKPRNITIYN